MQTKRVIVTFILLALAGLAPAGAMAREPVTCAPINKAIVENLYTKWSKAIEEDTTKDVVALYAKDATLLPTVEVGPYTTPAEIQKYFEHFLEKKPVATLDEKSRVIRMGCNIAYDIGLYSFQVNGDKTPNRETVKARYTFIYKPVGGHWMIAHHHSSQQP